LGVSIGQNSLAQNRGERWQELTQIALGYSLGPEKSTNLETYELMNRPIIKNFQKHPGNQNAEIAHNIQVIEKISMEFKFRFLIFMNFIIKRLQNCCRNHW
jgi:hypothetical protein